MLFSERNKEILFSEEFALLFFFFRFLRSMSFSHLGVILLLFSDLFSVFFFVHTHQQLFFLKLFFFWENFFLFDKRRSKKLIFLFLEWNQTTFFSSSFGLGEREREKDSFSPTITKK